MDGDELDEELEDREGVGEAEDDSVLTVVDEWGWAMCERVCKDLSRLGRI